MTSKREEELINYMKGKETLLIEKSLAEFVSRLANDVCS
jgi:hypothetical protein